MRLDTSGEKIGIDVGLSDLRFFQVAVLVDRDDFLEEVRRIRNKWDLLKSLVPNNDTLIDEWEKVFFAMTDIEYRNWQDAESKYIKKYEKKNWVYAPTFPEKQQKYDHDLEVRMRSSRRGEFEWDVEKVRQRFKRPPTFGKVIKKAILCGSVLKEDFLPCYVKVQTPEREHFSSQTDSSEIVMVMDQFCTKNEVSGAYSRDFAKAREQLMYSVKDEYVNLYDPKNISEIKNFRKWYWMNKSGKSYRDICLEVGNQKDREEYSIQKVKDRTHLSYWGAVTAGVKRYKKLLDVNI